MGEALDFTERIATWPTALSRPHTSARIKACPEDFLVSERLGFALDDVGDHLCLLVKKRNLNTRMLLDCVATALSVKQVDVGYFGLKDKRAVTEQWISVHVPGRVPELLDAGTEPLTLAIERAVAAHRDLDPAQQNDRKTWSINVTALRRHSRKFRPGQHRANQFHLRMTGISGDTASVDRAITTIRQQGFPNYFGPQRFGHGAKNLQDSSRLLLRRPNKRPARIGRARRSMLYSALRSFLFNEVLAEQLTKGNWLDVSVGDVLMLEGSRSIFTVRANDIAVAADNNGISGRLASGDVHPTGPMWGLQKNSLEPGSDVLYRQGELEREVLSRYPEFCAALVDAKLGYQRRALRVMAGELSWSWTSEDDGDVLELQFELPGGVYATSLLRELLCLRQ